MNNKTITFIGAGNMARSIIGGLVNKGYPVELITAADPNEESLAALKQDFSINTNTNNSEAVALSDVVLLAVKPQVMEVVLGDLQATSSDLSDKLFISIAAGISQSRLLEMLGGQYKIIRTMPNTPALLGLGMTGLYAAQGISEEEKAFAEQMMQAVGKTVWVDTESGIDDVIAVSGSAPAYFFLFMEAIEQHAIELGFTAEQSREIVQQVALGSAQMVCHNDVPISELRSRVTSKGGTTAEAIKVFEDKQLREITKDAMQAAIIRAQEMAKLI